MKDGDVGGGIKVNNNNDDVNAEDDKNNNNVQTVEEGNVNNENNNNGGNNNIGEDDGDFLDILKFNGITYAENEELQTNKISLIQTVLWDYYIRYNRQGTLRTEDEVRQFRGLIAEIQLITERNISQAALVSPMNQVKGFFSALLNLKSSPDLSANEPVADNLNKNNNDIEEDEKNSNADDANQMNRQLHQSAPNIQTKYNGWGSYFTQIVNTFPKF